MKFRQICWYFLLITILIAYAIGFISLAGFFGNGILGHYAWQLDLLSHFRMQYVWILFAINITIFILIFLAGKRRFIEIVAAGVSVFFFVINLIQVAPYYQSPQITTQKIITHIKILHINVLGPNRNISAVRSLIKTTNADIVNFQEYNNWWLKELDHSDVMKAYPYRYSSLKMDDGLYSKFPFKKLTIDYLPQTEHKDQTIIADFIIQGQQVTLLSSHPPTPIKPDLYRRLKMHFARWEQLSPIFSDNLIVIGDLNTSPWSYPFRKFIQALRLRDTQIGFGIQPSYPTFNALKAVPIDHCLIRGNLITLSRKLGPNIGSDHFPVLIELGLVAKSNG